MTNLEDFRVPPTQAFELYHALKDNGVETEFVGFQGRTHASSDPVNARERTRLWIELGQDAPRPGGCGAGHALSAIPGAAQDRAGCVPKLRPAELDLPGRVRAELGQEPSWQGVACRPIGSGTWSRERWSSRRRSRSGACSRGSPIDRAPLERWNRAARKMRSRSPRWQRADSYARRAADTAARGEPDGERAALLAPGGWRAAAAGRIAERLRVRRATRAARSRRDRATRARQPGADRAARRRAASSRASSTSAPTTTATAPGAATSRATGCSSP